jgi:hypothetical protein
VADLRRLADAHRTSQARLADAMAARLLAAYSRLLAGGGFRQDSTVQAWLAEMLPLIVLYRERSAGRAQAFYERATPGLDLSGIAPDPVPDEAIETSLRVTGVIGLFEALGNGKPFDEAVKGAAKAAAGAAQRHTLNAGRTFIGNAIERDTTALGHYRLTRAGCCSFCAVLASRGAVYKGDSFADSDPRFIGGESEEKVHDHCRCQLVPVKSRSDALPDLTSEFADLWAATSKGRSGKDALNAFRREYEAKFLRA